MDGQNEQEVIDQPQYMPTYQAQPPDIVKFMLDINEEIKRFEHFLRGEQEIDGEWVEMSTVIGTNPDGTEKTLSDRVMNEKGIMRITGFMKMYLGRQTYLSNLEQQELYDFTLNFSNTLAQMLYNNGEEFELDWNNAMQNSIIDMASDLVFMSFARAKGDRERGFWGSHTSVVHTINENPKNQNKEGKRFGIF